MSLDDRLIWLTIGCILGFFAGYLTKSLRDIKEELNEVDQILREDHGMGKKEQGGFLTAQTANYIMLGIVVLITAWAAVSSQKASNDVEASYTADKIARCKAGVEVRVVERQTVDAIFTLATGSLQRSPKAAPLTNVQRREFNAYIDRVNDFRDNMYSKIGPSKECAPYVNDDKVAPPTPPFPHLKRHL